MSCLFNSLEHFIGENSFEIRKKICDYLENNNSIIDGLETNTILNFENNNYIQNMRNMSTWGGAIEIQSACNIWNLRIIVINNRDNENIKIEFLPINTNYEKTITIEWTGGHYSPVIN
jgi:hypothetical protein